MRMSVGVTYSTADNAYEIFSEKRADALVDRLLRANLVVGFNVVDFDYEVLMGYTPRDLGYSLNTLDILVEVEAALGHRVKLDSIARATLGVGKTGDGLDAIRWFQEGRLLDVAEYCCYDVKVTRMVHEYGIHHGELAYTDRGGQRRTFPVNWNP